MKPIIKMIFLVLLCYASAFSQTGKISAQISGIKNQKGVLRIVLFNKSQGFPSDYKYGLFSKSQPIDTTLISVIFDSVAYGDYALSVLHDENENGKIDTNFLGVPKEGYGVSNNVNPKMRAPRFDEARFILKEVHQQIKVRIHYR